MAAAKPAGLEMWEAKRVEMCRQTVPAFKALCDQHSHSGCEVGGFSRLHDALGPVATAKLTGEAKLPELCARTVPALKTLCETRLQSGAP